MNIKVGFLQVCLDLCLGFSHKITSSRLEQLWTKIPPVQFLQILPRRPWRSCPRSRKREWTCCRRWPRSSCSSSWHAGWSCRPSVASPEKNRAQKLGLVRSWHASPTLVKPALYLNSGKILIALNYLFPPLRRVGGIKQLEWEQFQV